MTKLELKDLILQVQSINGNLSLHYVPSSVIDDIEELYGLYYGGGSKINVGIYYNAEEDFVKVTHDNIDEIVDKIDALINDNISSHITKALKNLNWADEELKYFDRSEDNHKTFKDEVLRLQAL